MKKRIACLLMTLIMLVSLVPAAALTASAASLTTSEAAIKVLTKMEGYRKTCYADNGQQSIGYGTVCNLEGAHGADHTITQAEADEAMREELAKVDEAVNNFAASCGLALSQNKHDALVLFSYNCGTAWMNGNGTFKKAVTSGATGNEFLYAIGLWSNINSEFSSGLMNRRLAEANMYLNGAYDTAAPSNYTYVTYNANGEGASVTDKMQAYIVGSSVGCKSTATNSDYTFMGWYDAAQGGAWISSLSSAKKGATLYANWQAKDAEPEDHVVSYTVKASQLASMAVYYAPNGKEWTEQTTAMKDKTQFAIIRDYIDGSGNRWCRISGSGWVKLGTNEAETGTGDQDATVTSLTVTVTNSYINVRDYPSTTSGKLVGKVNQNDKLVITEVVTKNNMKWGKFEDGWVALMYTNYDSVIQQSGSSSEDAEDVIATAVVKCSSTVNVRNSAGMSGAVIGSLRNGTKVNIYEIVTKNGHDWGRISDGWFCLDYATVTETASGSDSTDKDETTDSNACYTGTVVGCTYLKVREGAGTTKAQIGQIACGTKVSIYETTTVNGHDWGRTADGWICLDYVQLDASTGSNTGSTTQAKPVSYTAKTIEEVEARKAAGENKAVAATIAADKTVTVHELASVIDKSTSNPDDNTTITTTTTTYWARIDEGWVPVESIELDDLESVSYTVISDTLNVRAAAGAANEKVDVLSKGTEVEITDLEIVGTSVWGYADEFGGWINISSEYAEVTKAPETEEDTNSGTAVEDGYMTGTVVCNTTVNIRECAGTGYKVVDKVTNGTRLTINKDIVTKNGHDWGELKGGGWICLDYVQLDSTSTGSTGGTDSGSTGSILGTGIVTSSIQLNVREGAGLGYNIVNKLNPGTEVTVYEQKLTGGMSWGRIDGGWVCLSYVRMTSTGSTGSTGSGVMGTIANTYSGVNIRSNPGTSSALLGKILPGTRVEIFEQKLQGGSYWGRVSQGWICMDYVLLDSELPEGAEGIIMGSGSTGGSTSTSTSVSYTGEINTAVDVSKEAGSDKTNGITLAAGDAVTVYELSAVTTETTSKPTTNGDGSVSTTVTKSTTYWARIDEGWVPIRTVTLDALNEETYTVTADTLNVRNGAGMDYDKVTALAMGDKVTVTELEIVNDSVWAKVETADATTGWVNISYMTKGSIIVVDTTTNNTATNTTTGTTTGTTANTTNTTTTNKANGYLYTGTVIGSDKVNVRQQPSTGSNKTTTLKRGAAVVIYELAVGDNMAWGRCDAGWISLVYVDLVPYNSTAIDARVVQVEGTNIRESADANSELVGSYAKNTVIDIYEFVGNWARTNDGWVHTDNLLA